MNKSKPRIFFDIDAAAQAKKSGVGYYSLGLLQALAESNRFKITAHSFNFLGKSSPGLPKLENVTYVSSKLLHRKLFNLLRRFGVHIPIEFLARKRFDFSLFPNFLAKKSLRKTKFAVTVHDLAYIRYASTVSARNRNDLTKFVPRSITEATFVIAISDTVASELREQYRIPPDKKIVVTKIPPDIQNVIEDPKQILAKKGISNGFILFLGNLEPRKNLINLIEAYAKISPELRSKYSLVVAGNLGWNNNQITQRISQLQKAGVPIIATGYVSEKTRSALYRKAALVVVPSLYEGYGMTLVEAMKFDRPLAASRIPVFEEITKGNAYFFDPLSIDSIKESMEKGLTNGQAAITAGYSDVLKDLTWPQTTHELMQEIDSAC